MVALLMQAKRKQQTLLKEGRGKRDEKVDDDEEGCFRNQLSSPDLPLLLLLLLSALLCSVPLSLSLSFHFPVIPFPVQRLSSKDQATAGHHPAPCLLAWLHLLLLVCVMA